MPTYSSPLASTVRSTAVHLDKSRRRYGRSRPITHSIVWDWNGTLFDDRDLLFQTIAVTLNEEGYGSVSVDQVAASFTRPLRALIERVVGHPLPASDWERVQATFHHNYRSRLSEGSLVMHAREVLSAVKEVHAGQFLVSQWPHSELTEIVHKHRLTDLFDEVRGGHEGEDKATNLKALLKGHQLDPNEVVLIGDAAGDIDAALSAGIRAVMVTGASLAELDRKKCAALRIPIASSLREAAQIVRSFEPPQE